MSRPDSGERVRLLSVAMSLVAADASPREIAAACIMLLATMEVSVSEIDQVSLAALRVSTDHALKSARDGYDALVSREKN